MAMDEEPKGYAAVLLAWDEDNLDLLVEAANEVTEIADPWWLSRPDGQITADSFVKDFLAELERRGGGVWEKVCVAPNTANQLAHVAAFLGHVQTDPFIQRCLASVRDGVVLKIATMENTPDTEAAPIPMNYAPIPNQRQFFR